MSSAALLAAASLAVFPAVATAQVAGPTTPTASLITSPGVAGVANPATFSVFTRPGIAGSPALLPGAPATLGPGVAGVREPASFSPITRPALVGAGPLSPGLTATPFPAVVGTTPGTLTAPGVAGPTNPMAFDPTSAAGVSTGPNIDVVSRGAVVTPSRGDLFAAPSSRTTLSNVDLSSRTALLGRTSGGGATAALVISNARGTVTTEPRE